MLGSKPSRDAGNPPVIKLAQAVRIERTWASFRATLGYQQPTPEEIWRAVKESNPARPVLETNPRPAPNPNWRIADHSKAIPSRIRTGFQPASAPWLIYYPSLAETAGVEPARPVRTIIGFKPNKRANACLHDGGWRCSRNTCPRGHHLFSRQRPVTYRRHHPCMAESSELESHTREGALRLANEPEPCPVYSP